MSETQVSVLNEFEAIDKKLAKQQKRIRRAKLILTIICFWSTYVSVLVVLGSKTAYVHPAYVVLYVASYFLARKWPGFFLFVASVLWAWNTFISCIERLIILVTAYYRDYGVDQFGAYIYALFTLEVLLKITALIILLIGVKSAIHYRIIFRSAFRNNK